MTNTRQAAQTMESLMAQALLMEREAVARYTELAEMMETHNNTEVAELFRKMAEYEGHHVAQILDDMGWAEDEYAPHDSGTWATAEPPESVPVDEMHYLMHPWRRHPPRRRGDARRGSRTCRADQGVAAEGAQAGLRVGGGSRPAAPRGLK
jgi:hypothetical protein